MPALYQVAAPENYSARTHKAYRNITRAERAMKRIDMKYGKDASKLRMMDLRHMTGDARDVYFMVSWNLSTIRPPRKWSYRPTRTRNKARIVAKRCGDVLVRCA